MFLLFDIVLSMNLLNIYRISHVFLYDFYPTSYAFSIPKPWQGDSKHEVDQNHITSQNMGDSFYHIFANPYLFLFTLFFRCDKGNLFNTLCIPSRWKTH
jgi:hypothetical protein